VTTFKLRRNPNCASHWRRRGGREGIETLREIDGGRRRIGARADAASTSTAASA